MLRFLTNLFRRKPWPEPPVGTYPVYATRFDEVIDAAELRRQSPHAREAWDAWLAMETELAAEISALSARATAMASESAETKTARRATLLIDHSGSMRGAKLHMAAVFARTFADLCGALDIRYEILGFTTVEWKGEPARTDWMFHDRQPYPGRLCALRHIVYSAFADTAPLNMSTMFDPSLLKENVDGEALAWAAERLGDGEDGGDGDQVLLVLSDGAPVDDSTLSATWPTFLEDHLKSVIAELTANDAVTLGAIGLGYDVSRYYPDCTMVRNLDEMRDTALPFLHALLARAR